MRTYFECIPCLVRQILDAVRLVSDDEAVIEATLRRTLKELSESDLRQPPPALGVGLYRLVKERAAGDPLREQKARSNRFALSLLPEMRRRVAQSDRPFETAVRLAIAGNIIDFGHNSNVGEAEVHASIEHALDAPLDRAEVGAFRRALDEADRVLYLADNAGEIVFDRLLIERIPADKVTFVVKGGPIINDALREDAEEAGLTDLVEVVDNGSDAAGTLLDLCTDDFRHRFETADMVVAKGQGNYETLSDAPREIWFLLKAKCPVVAENLGLETGSLALRRGGN